LLFGVTLLGLKLSYGTVPVPYMKGRKAAILGEEYDRYDLYEYLDTVKAKGFLLLLSLSLLPFSRRFSILGLLLTSRWVFIG